MSEAEAARVVVLLTAVAGLVIGGFSLAISAREWRRGSPTWVWALPGVVGIVLISWCLFRLWWWAA